MLDINIISCMIIRTNYAKSISPKMNRLNVIILTYTHSVMLSVSETPSAGRPLSGTLRVPPLPLQRESMLPEGWFTAKMNAIKKPKRKIKILRFGFLPPY